MRKLMLLVGYLVALFTGAVKAQPVATSSLLWKISGKNLAKPSYLFGTIHLICRNDYVWTKAMDASLNTSEKVCFEMALDDPSVMAAATTGMMNKDGKKLKDYFTAEQYKILTAYVRDTLKMDIAMFENMRPVALQMMLGTNTVACADQVSYEDSMMVTAKAQHKPVLGLELAQEQLDVLGTIPEDSVVADIIATIQHPAAADEQYEEMVLAYKRQDLKKLFDLINSVNEAGSDMGVFLDQRNTKWVPRMETMMKDGTIFFAVGAGHLPGDKGVINLLKKQGYKVEPILN